jgi:hypothetical protein
MNSLFFFPLEIKYYRVGCEMLTAMVMKTSIFRYITHCRALLATCFMLVSCLAYIFNPEDEGDMFLRNVG